MKLTPEQIKAFDEQGYVFFPDCFSEEEIALLRYEADNILKLDRPEVGREKSGAPRTAFAAHKSIRHLARDDGMPIDGALMEYARAHRIAAE